MTFLSVPCGVSVTIYRNTIELPVYKFHGGIGIRIDHDGIPVDLLYIRDIVLRK